MLIVKELGRRGRASVGYEGVSSEWRVVSDERGVRSEGGGGDWAEIHGE